ncbi:uncharacterized protein LOC5505744 [Nematostella vectensis]|uniref:uncharacterized protein LOC5505744 n=1 Tax=Nematostella vectensis TaxID=45351 RepID=UPI0020775745|nr:uncharacterized protein LOC5505744 [Nematostella vectensis]
MSGTSKGKTEKHHHDLSNAVRARQESNIEQLATSIRNFTNPFLSDSSDLFNIATKVVMPDKVKEDLCQQSTVGTQLLSRFVEERVTTATQSIWHPMKKRKLDTWKSATKIIRVKAKVIELKEDRSLFARMSLVAKSRPEIDMKEAVGEFEFNVVPKSMFAQDGSVLHCSCKSALMAILEKVANTGASSNTAELEIHPPIQEGTRMKVSIVDGMAEVQALDKPSWIKNCSQLADHFLERVLYRYHGSDELQLVFHRYDVPLSLETATRVSRQGKEAPIYYKISDATHIAKIPMKRLLSHVKTKSELTEYLAVKLLEKGKGAGMNVVVAWGTRCQATHRDMAHLESNHEEADTKLLLHAVDATSFGATSIEIVSPDTGVFVLSLRRYSLLCEDTSFVTGRGGRHRKIKLCPIVRVLGPAKTAALPGFHAWSGADVTGSFAGKANMLCWKAFIDADQDSITALADLGTSDVPHGTTYAGIEKLVCKLYQPNTRITKVKDLRWLLFRKKQAESERLPPTLAALREATKRAHYQCMVWNSDILANPELPSPSDYGWKLEADEWVPVMTSLKPAPDAVLHLVKCGCLTERCSTNRWQCRKAGLPCTDLCGCADDEEGEPCQNVSEEVEGSESSDEEEEEDVGDGDHD